MHNDIRAHTSLYYFPSYLSEQNGHLVSPAALVERRHPDPQVQLRVVHPHITTVDASACKTTVEVVNDDGFLSK